MGRTLLPRINLRQFESLVLSGRATVPEITSYCRALAVAGEDVWKLNAFCTILPQESIESEAIKSQERWKSGKPLSPLDGVPVTVKANLAVATQPLTAGSAILGATSRGETPPVGYTSDVVRSLQSSGAIIIGITQMDEFGMGSLGTNVATGGPTKNPLSFIQENDIMKGDKRNITDSLRLSEIEIREYHEHLLALTTESPVSAGGSSCGSAASVAHGSSLLSLGSDTGGSVRLPAAWCGITGIRPTYGRLSRHGLVSYASSFDTVGVLANSPDCIGRALPYLVEYNDTARDSTLSVDSKNVEYWSNTNALPTQPLSDVKIGVPEAFSVSECPSQVSEDWLHSADMMNKAGAEVIIVPENVISSEALQRSLAAYFILVSAEASSNLARYDGFRFGVGLPDSVSSWDDESPFTLFEHQCASTRTAGFGPEVIRRILCGTATLSSDRFHTHYEGAARLRAELTKQLRASLNLCDLLLVPTVLFPPPFTDSKVDPTEVFANDVMTIPASLAGLPAVSVPSREMANANRFPPSMQIIGRPFEEHLVLRAATVLESGCLTLEVSSP